MQKSMLFNIMFILLIARYSFASHNCSEQLFVDSSSQYANYDTQEQYILLINTNNMDFKEWQKALNDAGINARHWFPPEAAIMVLRPEDDFTWHDNIPAKQYYDLSSEELSELSSTSETLRIAANAFIGLLDVLVEPAGEQHAHFIYQDKSDALIPPARESVLGYCSATNLKRSTSEYFNKSVSVNVILVESNGAIDTQSENWNATRENSVISEITQAMNFLSSAYTGVAVLRPSFTFHYYLGRTNALAQTSYEPIKRPADPNNEPGNGEGLWTNEIFNKLGYSSYANRWDKGQEFNGNTRISDGTTWAISIFVIDSLNDADGMFTDSYFAYSWLGGPHHVMTYDNDGWGISQMDVVCRHETSHNFYAVDEYSTSTCTCTQLAGYVNYQNQNCEKSCLYNGNCIMSSANKQLAGVVCSYTRGQIGWGDSDSDSIPDPVDIEPLTTLTAYTPDPTTSTLLNYQGQATIQAKTNQNLDNYHCDINILRIGGVQYNVDGGAWNSASACDGYFDSASECYAFTVGPLSTGTHTIQTRAYDELGQFDSTPASDTITITQQTGTLQSNRPAVNDSGSGTPNGVIEENELVTLVGNLQNNGGTTATSVTGVLSSSDPITINAANAVYPNIAPGGNQNCTSCYSITVPGANRKLTHWDINATEASNCSGCTASTYNFIYHVGNSFNDVPPTVIFYSYIETILHSGVTSGCGPVTYCPLNYVVREQMAKFICASMNKVNPGSCPMAGCAGVFGDVTGSNIFCSYIEGLYSAGIVSGCQASPLLYCPASNTGRQEMAKFVCSGMQVSMPGSCVTSSCAGIFTDVPASNPFCPYIEALYNAGVISGCTANAYCPSNLVSREQMSKFLVNGFNFTL